MDFLQAVTELAEGRCKGIKREGWSKDSVLAINRASVMGDELTFDIARYIPCVTDFTNTDWQLVDPVPQYEDVAVVRWLVESQPPRDQVFDSFYLAKQCCTPHEQPIKLVGTVKRPIKPKVKRCEEVRYCGGMGLVGKDYTKIPSNAKMYAEWEEDA